MDSSEGIDPVNELIRRSTVTRSVLLTCCKKVEGIEPFKALR